MSTAIDSWGNGESFEEGDHPNEFENSFGHNEGLGGVGEEGHNTGLSEEDAALALKKEKDKKTMKIAAGIVGAIILGVAGLSLMKPANGPVQSSVAQMPSLDTRKVAETPQVSALVPQDMTPGPQVASEKAIELNLAAASSNPPPPPVDKSPLPAIVTAPVAEVSPPMAPQTQVAPVAPFAQGAQVAPVIGKPTVVATAPVKDQGPELDVLQRRLKEKDNEILLLRNEVTELKVSRNAVVVTKPVQVKTVAQQPKEVFIQSKPVQVKAVAQQPKEVFIQSKAIARTATAVTQPTQSKVIDPIRSLAVVDPLVVLDTKQTAVEPRPALKGGRVRSDFSVYAISNGRAWLTWNKDGMNYAVGTGSELPDASKVVSIDDVGAVVATTSGEVHAKPPTR